MTKSNAQKKAELQFLLTSLVEGMSDKLPKGIGMLVKAITKQIDEKTINETLDQVLDFLSNAYVHVERIRADEVEETNGIKLIQSNVA